MTAYHYGDQAAPNVLVQLVNDHGLVVIESEVEMIRQLAGTDFLLIAINVGNWNYDLSPWNAPAVFGKEDFGNGADETLNAVLTELQPISDECRYHIGGYSLSGLFSLWSAYRTDLFSGVAAVSPSIWFPGFIEYMREHDLHTDSVYLSLGDREEMTGNPIMSTVGTKIRDAHALLAGAGVHCKLEWNRGNHFREPDLRMAKAFAWLLQNSDGRREHD